MRRYIVVDDDPTNNLICSLLIKKFHPGAEIEIFTKAEDALEFIRTEKDPTSSILFLDVNLQTMTGWEFLDVFATFKEETKVRYLIYVLSSSYQDFSDKSLRYPFLSGFLSKPLKADYFKEIEP